MKLSNRAQSNEQCFRLHSSLFQLMISTFNTFSRSHHYNLHNMHCITCITSHAFLHAHTPHTVTTHTFLPFHLQVFPKRLHLRVALHLSDDVTDVRQGFCIARFLQACMEELVLLSCILIQADRQLITI